MGGTCDQNGRREKRKGKERGCRVDRDEVEIWDP